jgi:hypothetical protein
MKQAILVGIVVLIAGAIASTMFVRVGSHPGQFAAVRVDLDSLKGNLETFRQARGRYPTEVEGLALCLPSGQVLRSDPWGHPYRYRLVAAKPEIRSAGPDGVFDTADDFR